MRISNIFILMILALVTISCIDEFESGIVPDKPGEVVKNENLNSYDVLKAYIDSTSNQNFKLSAYTSANDFLGKSFMYSLILTNFNQVTAYDVLSHGAVVQDDGTMDFTTVRNFIEEAKANELDIFGHSLCWHAEQNGTFLNGRYAAKVFETPAFPNLLDKAGLEDGTFNGWETNMNNGGTIDVTEYNGDKVVLLSSGANSSNDDDLSLISPSIPVTETTYEITMFILSDKEGKGRITFEGLINNTPVLDWTGTGENSDTLKLYQGWNKISFQLNEFADDNIKIHLDLSYTPGVNYYLHIDGLSVVDINSEFENPDEFFLEAENGAVGANWTIEDDADASGGKYAVVNDDHENLLTPGDDPANNIVHTFTVTTPGEYKFWVRGVGETADDDSFHFKVDDNDWYTWNSVLTPEYLWHIIDTFDLAVGEHTVTVSYRENGAKLDRLYFTLTDKTPTGMGSPAAKSDKIVLDLETAEKVSAIGGTLTEWISSVITEAKDDVNAWNVVNQPMDDANPYELRTAGNSSSEDEFYWQDYLGKDYAVMAFNTARENVKSGDLLFIGDYGLESNLDKCRGLIEYINYIENQGATVDGIAAQMHLSLETNEDNIGTMFQLLAATGKLVKVAQLEVSFPVDDEITEDILQQQAELYKTAVTMFYQHVPAEQRYGIEISGLVDTDNNAIGLWSSSYNRKPAYAGVADGIKDNQPN